MAVFPTGRGTTRNSAIRKGSSEEEPFSDRDAVGFNQYSVMDTDVPLAAGRRSLVAAPRDTTPPWTTSVWPNRMWL